MGVAETTTKALGWHFRIWATISIKIHSYINSEPKELNLSPLIWKTKNMLPFTKFVLYILNKLGRFEAFPVF
jgi:hypothetical protein